MKKLISILSLFLACFILFSCGNIEGSYKNKGQSTWFVTEINYESPTTATYKAITTDTTDLVENDTWFADTIGAFKVGDTLILRKKEIKKMKNLTLSDIIYLSQQTDNIIITNWLKELEQMIVENANNFELGSEIRKIL